MNPFAPTLKSIYEQLDLPQPEKSRILLEISADMEDCYQACLESGIPEKEAVQRTQNLFSPDSSNLRALVEIHTPPIKRMMDRFSRQAQSRWEKTMLLLLLCLILAFAGPDLISMQMIRDAGRYAPPILTFAFLGLLVFLYKTYNLNLKKSCDLHKLRDGTMFLLFLGGAGLMTGIVGSCTETMRFTRDVIADMDSFLFLFIRVLVQHSAMMTLGILNAICIGIYWFVLIRKIEEIEQSEIRILLKLK